MVPVLFRVYSLVAVATGWSHPLSPHFRVQVGKEIENEIKFFIFRITLQLELELF